MRFKSTPVTILCAYCGAVVNTVDYRPAKFCNRTCMSAYFKGKPKQSVRNRPTGSVIERFWSSVDCSGQCWLWIGSTNNSGGYGRLIVGYQANGKSIRDMAHRFSWMLHKGSIPPGMQICHNCPGGDNPACVNPDHLFLGTQADNMADAVSKGRRGCWTKPDCVVRGERHCNRKLTEEKVVEIRRRYAAGSIGHRALAREFGVSNTTIRFIIQRRTWSHI